MVQIKKPLSGAWLKHIAMVTMFLDHLDKTILFEFLQRRPDCLPLLIFSSFCEIVGRFAFPIFCFLLIEGFFHTRNPGKYLLNLVVFAFISEIPFDLCFNGVAFLWQSQNVFFTLALGLCLIWAVEEMKQRFKWWYIPGAFLFILTCIVAMFLSTDYGSFGIAVIAIWYLLRSYPFAASVIAFVPLWKTVWALPGFLMTNLYNGKRGQQYKWLNYWFYPAHLLLLALLRYTLF